MHGTRTLARGIFTDKARSKTEILVCLYLACGNVTIYIVHDIELVTDVKNPLWIGDREPAVLCVYGKYKAAMEKIVAHYLETDPGARCSRPYYGSPG